MKKRRVKRQLASSSRPARCAGPVPLSAAYYQWQEGRGSLRQAADAALTAAIRAIHVASVKDRVTRAPSSFNLPPSLRFMPSSVSYDVVAASAPTLGLRRPGGNHWGRHWG